MRSLWQALKLLPAVQQQSASSLLAPAASGTPAAAAVLQQARGIFTAPPHDASSSSSSPQAIQQQQLREQSTAAQPLFARGRTDAENQAIVKKGIKLLGTPMYLDMQATTPLDPRVVDAMLPFMTGQFGNPHSRTHYYGWESEEAMETARGEVAKLIGADAKEIIFTSGATESNNLAIKGVAQFYREKKKHIITTQTEHKCVLDSCRWLQQRGFDVTYLPVQKDGLVDLDLLKSAIRPDTALVSVMTVNNEIGVIQPIKEIGDICRSRNVFFHTDAAQAVGKIPLNVHDAKVDLMSISGHKLYGPKGIGAIYLRRRPRVRVEPLMSGGGQERGIRSGTVPAMLAVGLGEAARVSQKEMAADTAHIIQLEKRLREGLMGQLTGVELNGPNNLQQRYPGNLNLSFAYVEGESLIMGLKCSHMVVLTLCRYGMGRFTTVEEVDRAIELTVNHVNKLRQMSPLWEMVQEGIDIKTIQWSQH
ncbi:pyridoxal phosphate-dependent transferase [Dunaliella salina]|uniref:cysteine desulfurase n=1 Tax=Dunaliella salina TaxID=3046 RepID=A0ABQ7G5N0_DUNSA|nr:pyridoxal phosphate-dependent transferase [Dunaliella salina]|eukprot:KAF5829919.1 pyridoxal phosphate-dependent transferase [Dunaliella salina]